MARTLPKSMTGIFHDVQRNRQEPPAPAPDVLRRVVQHLPDKIDLQFSATTTLERAEARKAVLEQLNPGKHFTIIAR